MARLRFGRYDYASFICFFAYAACSVILPVSLVPLAAELGFSLEEGGMTAGGAMQLGRTISMLLIMLSCGFIAGHIGKRWTMGLSVLVMGIGIMTCAISPSYWILFIAMSIAGMGEGVIEGLATPFIQDLHTDEPGRYINFTHSFWSVGVVVTVLVVGALLSMGVSWRVLLASAAGLSILTSLIYLAPQREGKEYPDHPERIHWSITLNHAKDIITTRHFWLFFAAMFFAGGGEFGITFWTASFIQLNFVSAAWAGGVGTACFAGGMFLGRSGWGFFIKQHQLKYLVAYSAASAALITLALPFVQGLWVLFVLLFLTGVCVAPFWPSVQSYSTNRLHERDTTMIFILLSCAGIPGCGVITWLMGLLGNIGGLRMSFFVIPACFAILAILITADIVYARAQSRRQSKQALAPESEESSLC
ncbi:putative sialic acid transporter [Limihaloglobus sulfuriphilus]|uniref:Putative sialic acid transporter n=1 Tax=Limihaloglobus sulfuriphilus TaxID=1851148 RepID=A0A1Q2MEV0_9BACT|nr:MFS transporter [Limihaloglobus sulfuriphilus]AQQ71200.1 putative sialic acid transporter [Limihaloglobus sulfuriphilus]